MSAAAARPLNLAYEVSNISILPRKVKELDQLANQNLQKVKAQGIAIRVKMDSLEVWLKNYGCSLPSTWTSLKHTVDTPDFTEVDRDDLIAAVKDVESAVSGLQKQADADSAASRVAKGLPAKPRPSASATKIPSKYAGLSYEEIHKHMGKLDKPTGDDSCVIL